MLGLRSVIRLRFLKMMILNTVFLVSCNDLFASANHTVTFLDVSHYNHLVSTSQEKAVFLIAKLPRGPTNLRLQAIVQHLLNTPYLHVGAMGEGDWVSTSPRYQPGARHLQQDPVYRFDGLDCQTFVQTVLAMFYSNNLSEFEKNILSVAYGATSSLSARTISYSNRNHFIDGDFNPINERNGFLKDVTQQGMLAKYAKTTHAVLNRQKWFQRQLENHLIPRLLSGQTTQWVSQHLVKDSQEFAGAHLQQKITINYLPKNYFAYPDATGDYHPNQETLRMIQTPAIAEVVRDPQRWHIGKKLMRDIIGSDLTVSHLGIIYWQTFRNGQIIYQKIMCHEKHIGPKLCKVKPMFCQKKNCRELMFAHATNAYPFHYYWYQDDQGQFQCSLKLPRHHIGAISRCNRVEQLPLVAYLTDLQYDLYRNIDDPSLLGIHIERIVNH